MAHGLAPAPAPRAMPLVSGCPLVWLLLPLLGLPVGGELTSQQLIRWCVPHPAAAAATATARRRRARGLAADGRRRCIPVHLRCCCADGSDGGAQRRVKRAGRLSVHARQHKQPASGPHLTQYFSCSALPRELRPLWPPRLPCWRGGAAPLPLVLGFDAKGRMPLR